MVDGWPHVTPLPAKLWLQIADYLERPDLNRFSRPNHGIYSLLLPTPLPHFILQEEKHPEDQTRQPITRINSNPDLSQAIRPCPVYILGPGTLDFAAGRLPIL